MTWYYQLPSDLTSKSRRFKSKRSEVQRDPQDFVKNHSKNWVSASNSIHLPSGILKMAIYSGFTWIYPLKMVIFHSYVSLPKGSKGYFTIFDGAWGPFTEAPRAARWHLCLGTFRRLALTVEPCAPETTGRRNHGPSAWRPLIEDLPTKSAKNGDIP